MQTFRAAALAAALIAAGLTGGCAITAGEAAPAAAADESAEFAPVSYRNVCLLENDAVRSPKLVDAIESGLRGAGAEVKRLPSGSGPDACPFVITYEVPDTDGVVNTIRYQTFEHGIPRVDATGTAPEGRALTVKAVEAYSAELLGRLTERAAAQPAPASGG